MPPEDGEQDDWAAQPSATSIVADVEAGESSGSGILQQLQSVSTTISLFLSPIAIILVSVWVSNESMGGGGVSWSEGDAKRVFNWHPVLMIVAYSIMNAAALIFRASGTSSYQTSTRGISDAGIKRRGTIKAIHGYVWVASFLIGMVAMMAVVKSHNDAVSGYIANLYSLHSWVGVLVISLYTLQLLVGIFAFGGLMDGTSRLAVPSLMEIHKYTGAVLHLLITATIMLGIQEKEGFVKCWYEVTEPDFFPIQNYGKIPSACKISHGLGIVVLLMGVFTSFALARFPVL
jgi:cytochrome b-561